MRSLFLNTSFTILVSFLFLSMAFPVSAQQSGTDPLFIDVQPSSPAPGAKTTISIDSSTYDLGQASIRWTLNGNPSDAGSGVRSFTFTMGPSGKTTIVGLTVIPLKGSPFTRTFTFRPGSVTLLWEADTYVPPFYMGRSLYSPGATVRVVAIPSVTDSSGALIPSSDLTFKWQIGGDAFADKSGLGVDTLTFKGNWQGGPEEVGVDVLRKDGLKAAHAVVFIQDLDPFIRFYRRDPLRGTLYERALMGDEKLPDAETTIVAEPFFVSGSVRSISSLKYEWTLNGKPIDPQGADPGVVTLRQTGAQLGTAVLSLSVQNSDLSKLLQQASATVNLILGGQQNNSVFGL